MSNEFLSFFLLLENGTLKSFFDLVKALKKKPRVPQSSQPETYVHKK